MSYVQKWLWSCVSTLIGSVVCKVRDNIWPCPLSSVRGMVAARPVRGARLAAASRG